MTENTDAFVGERICNRRLANGITRQQLACRAGIELQQLRAYEEGTVRVPASHLWSIAIAQGMPIAYYFQSDQDADEVL